jgi:hypothetical protein
VAQISVPVNPKIFEGEKVRMLSLIGERRCLLKLRELVEEGMLKELEEAFEEAQKALCKEFLIALTFLLTFH